MRAAANCLNNACYMPEMDRFFNERLVEQVVFGNKKDTKGTAEQTENVHLIATAAGSFG